MHKKYKNLIILILFLVIVFFVNKLFLESPRGIKIAFWLRNPSQEIKWQGLHLTVPRGWYVDVRKDKQGISLWAVSRIVNIAEKNLSDRTRSMVIFLEKLPQNQDKGPVYLEQIYESCLLNGERKTIYIDGIEAELQVLLFSNEQGKQVVDVVGAIPSAQIKFYATVDRISDLYSVLNGIRWKKQNNIR